MKSKLTFTGHKSEQAITKPRSPVVWIIDQLRHHPILLVGALLFSVIEWSAYGLGPIMIGKIAHIIITDYSQPALLSASLGLLGVEVLSSLVSVAAALCGVSLSHRLEHGARDRLFKSLLSKSQTFHNRQRTGDLVARSTDDTRHLNYMIHPGLRFLCDMFLGFLVPIVYVLLIDPQLLLIPIIYVVIFSIAVRDYVRRISPVLMDQHIQYAQITTNAEESVTGIEAVKAAVRETWERKRFYLSASRYRDLFVRQGKLEALYVPMLLYGVAAAAALLHGITLLNSGVIQLSELIAFVALFHLLRIPTFMSEFTFILIQNGIAGAKRIIAILDDDSELKTEKNSHIAPIQGNINFDQVSFSYNQDREVVTDFNIKILAGETIAIVGQTGSGKTTLTQLITRTYDPNSGSVSIDGIDLRRWDLTSLRSQIAVIEQDIFLFSKTIRENIAFALPGADDRAIEEAARSAAAHEFIDALKDGYNTEIGERGVTLSGGQRQRLAIARAFLKDPRILILDDSTSAIDSKTEDEIQQALNAVQHNRTTLIITHRLSQIRWADRVLVLSDHRIVADGNHENLISTSEPYRRIFSHYDIDVPAMEISKIAKEKHK